MTEKIVGSIVRHSLTGVGAAGLVTGDQTQQIISAISIIVSVVWSIIQKKNSNATAS